MSNNEHSINPEKHLNKYQLLLIVTVIQYLFFFVAWAYGYIRGNIFGESFPFDTFLPNPPPFGDFLIVVRDWSQGDLTTSGYGRNYFPGLYLPMQLFVPLENHMYRAVLIGIGLPFILTTLIWLRNLKGTGTFTSALAMFLVVSSYPVLFMLETGNLELWILLLISAGLYFFQKRHWYLFAIAVGIATAFKGFPFIFMIIPFVQLPDLRKLLRVLTLFALTSLLVTFVALAFLPGGYIDSGWTGVYKSVEATIVSLDLYKVKMWYEISGMHFGHSFLNAIHAILGIDFMPTENWGIGIQLAGLFLVFVLAVFMRKGSHQSWKVWMLVALGSCLFSPTSTDYKLVYFIPAFILLVVDIHQGKFTNKNSDLFLLISFPILFSPKPWLPLTPDPFSTAQIWLATLIMIIDLAIISKDAFIDLQKHSGNSERAIVS